MTDYNLLPEEVFVSLPDEPGEQFLLLVGVVESNFNKLKSKPSIDTGSLRRQFVDQIKMISKEVNIGGLTIVSSGSITLGEFTDFQNGLVPIKSRIRMQRAIHRTGSVQLGIVARAHIEIEIERLRDIINSSSLPESKKKKINTKLDELVEELNKKRLGFAKLLTIAAAIAGIVGGSASALANGSEALERIGSILHWVGGEIEAEEAEQLRLSGPLMALPPPAGDGVAESSDPAASTGVDQAGDDDAVDP